MIQSILISILEGIALVGGLFVFHLGACIVADQADIMECAPVEPSMCYPGIAKGVGICAIGIVLVLAVWIPERFLF